MRSLTRLAALFVILTLAGCVQGTTGQAGAPYPPHPPETNGDTPEHGGSPTLTAQKGS